MTKVLKDGCLGVTVRCLCFCLSPNLSQGCDPINQWLVSSFFKPEQGATPSKSQLKYHLGTPQVKVVKKILLLHGQRCLLL